MRMLFYSARLYRFSRRARPHINRCSPQRRFRRDIRTAHAVVGQGHGRTVIIYVYYVRALILRELQGIRFFKFGVPNIFRFRNHSGTDVAGKRPLAFNFGILAALEILEHMANRILRVRRGIFHRERCVASNVRHGNALLLGEELHFLVVNRLDNVLRRFNRRRGFQLAFAVAVHLVVGRFFRFAVIVVDIFHRYGENLFFTIHRREGSIVRNRIIVVLAQLAALAVRPVIERIGNLPGFVALRFVFRLLRRRFRQNRLLARGDELRHANITERDRTIVARRNRRALDRLPAAHLGKRARRHQLQHHQQRKQQCGKLLADSHADSSSLTGRFIFE